MRRIYFDHQATTDLHPEVKEILISSLSLFGNPQTIYYEGRKAKEALERARKEVAELINASPEEVFFTSSGAESNNWAIKGIALANQGKGNHIIASPIEHISILTPLKRLQNLGFSVTFLPVDQYGRVDPDEVKKAIRKETILITIQHASNEIGTIQNLEEIGRFAQEAGIALHADAVASCGHYPIDVQKLNVSSLALSAHTFYGPKGVGSLFIKKGTKIFPLIEGGWQEEGRRAGTENLLGIIGMGKACAVAKREMGNWIERIKPLRDRLIREIPAQIERSYLTGHPTERLFHHTSFCFEFIEGEALLLYLDEEGIASASGSACTSRTLKSSHVLQAIGIDPVLAQGSIIFSLGRENTEDDITYLLTKLAPIVERLRQMSPLYDRYLKEKKIKGG
jgi:cysteine desulfurase|uniref:Cysteine desulfurase n=1 Tax=candidate division WOR-3 bacterium TaxID=2052148 RepID=A0A7C3UPD0_UNCW3